MNAGNLNGFRNTNPQDVLKTAGFVADSEYKRGRFASSNEPVVGFTPHQTVGMITPLLASFPITPMPENATYTMICGTDTTLVIGTLTYNSGANNTSLTTWSTKDLMTWSTVTTVISASNIAASETMMHWTGNEFFFLGADTGANAQYGFFSTDLTSWTRFTLSTDSNVHTISATVSKTYVVTMTEFSGFPAAYTCRLVARPLSGSPTITTASTTPTSSNLSSFSLNEDRCIVGNKVTTNFSTFTSVLPAGGNIINAQAHVAKTYFLATSSFGILFSSDGFKWNLAPTTNNQMWVTYEHASTGGTLLLSPYSAIQLSTGQTWIHDEINYNEYAYSGPQLLVKFKHDLYYWQPTMPMIRRYSLSGTQPGMSVNTYSSAWVAQR